MTKPLRFPVPAAATLTPEQAERVVETMCALADDVIAAEDRIKDLILEAIDGGDLARATEIATRWKVEAPVDLLASLENHRG